MDTELGYEKNSGCQIPVLKTSPGITGMGTRKRR